MFKQTATDLTKVSSEIVKKWLNSFDTVLTDCDGVLWMGKNAINGSADVINRLQELSKQVYFVTNNPFATRLTIQEKANSRGFNITEDGIFSAAHATAKYLEKRKFNKKAYLIGWEGLAQELDAVGIRHTDRKTDNIKTYYLDVMKDGVKLDPEIGAVVVGYDPEFNYGQLLMAANYLKNPDCLFIGTSMDELFPSNNGVLIPGVASSIRAIEVCIDRLATIVGKPEPWICKSLLVDGNIVPERTLMIGDRANTDILLGTNCGFQTMLVGTGCHSLIDVQRWRESNNVYDKKLLPDVYLPKLGDLLPFLK